MADPAAAAAGGAATARRSGSRARPPPTAAAPRAPGGAPAHRPAPAARRPRPAAPRSPAARTPAPRRRVPATAPRVPPAVRHPSASHTSTTAHAFRVPHFRRFWPRPAIMRHDPGLAASPRVRYTLRVERSGHSPFHLIVRGRGRRSGDRARQRRSGRRQQHAQRDSRALPGRRRRRDRLRLLVPRLGHPPLPLLEQARRLLATGGLLVSVEQDSHEFGIGAWGRMLDRTRSRVPGGPTLTVRTDESKPVKIRHNSRRPGSRPRSLAGKILEIALTPGVAADGGAAMPAGGGGRAGP